MCARPGPEPLLQLADGSLRRDLPDAEPHFHQGKILFINAVHDVARERALSFLKSEHQQRILAAYQAFADEPGFAKVATLPEVLQKDGNCDPALREADRVWGNQRWRPRPEDSVDRVRRKRTGVLAAVGRTGGHARWRRCRGGARCLKSHSRWGGRASASVMS